MEGLGSTKTVSRRGGESDKGSEARLSSVHPPELSVGLSLAGGAVVLGRIGTDDALAVQHATVSRRHAEIRFDSASGRHVIRDLGSHNGTEVAGVVVGERGVELADNAVVQLGDVLLVYERGADAGETDGEGAIPGRSRAMGDVRRLVGRASPDPSPVLISGETGTGKEWVAREVHRRSGRKGELVAINCAALSPQLIESELFGHVKGAFTGAGAARDGLFVQASGGTLLLDELGELPLELQPKLLRALQESEVRPVGGTAPRAVDVRVIAATNRDLSAEVRAGRFRRDLFARIALWEVALPPLRERRVDIAMWIDQLSLAWAEARGIEHTPPQFSSEAMAAILLHDWPENLRGIERLVHACAGQGGAAVDVDGLPPWLTEPSDDRDIPSPGASPRAAKPPIPTQAEFEATFRKLGGKVAAIARHYARDRRQIYRWLDKFGLRDPE